MKRLNNLIDWAQANKLEFHITENNVVLSNQQAGKWNDQAETFGAIVKLIKEKSKTGTSIGYVNSYVYIIIRIVR